MTAKKSSAAQRMLLTQRKRVEEKLFAMQQRALDLAEELERIDNALNALDGKAK